MSVAIKCSTKFMAFAAAHHRRYADVVGQSKILAIVICAGIDLFRQVMPSRLCRDEVWV